MAFLSVLVPSLTRVLGLISVSRYFCSGHARPLVSGGRKSGILYTIATCNQICHMTFSSLNSKGICSLPYRHLCTNRKALTCTHSVYKECSSRLTQQALRQKLVHSNTHPRMLSARKSKPFSADNSSLFPPVA